MRASRAWLPCLALVLLLPLTGCEGDAATDQESSPVTLRQRPAPAAGTDESLREAALDLVDARERALQDGDRDAFLSTVDADDLGFSATQARWFDNLALLPVTDVSFELGDEDVMSEVVRDGDLQLPIDFTMRLSGFDARPVTQVMVWTFVRRDGEVALANDHSAEVDAMTRWIPAPWDVAHIEVRRTEQILGIFDEDTVDHADYVMRDLAAAATVVREHLPQWTGSFVVYGGSDVTAMSRMTEMTVDETAGVAFPVLSRVGGRVAAYRFIVNPTVVGDVLSRSVVFRHELVHVALGSSDAWSPVWLVEGVAQYVALSPYPVDQRRLMAAQRLVGVAPRALEDSRAFYERNQGVNYALAALVCDYVASTRGEDAIWDLVRTFASGAGGAEEVVRRELGVSTSELSRQALAWARSA
ncbi:hypothetical protein [Nocardioides zhouii]|uniref:Peptidase MA-like domain-containing protein n=1 Tax=Nocardioides zhouii TaxID=1168729 RepID=A0A4Q2T2R3_9ACTN|nr:hypothetical protein [Nocardioides zhouii]RYC12996.1 hypothetical protein EUA94_07155 [Nocardioides zhouii]